MTNPLQVSPEPLLALALRKLLVLVLIAYSGAIGAADKSPNSELPSTVTYSDHIAPILRDHCIDCHRPGQIAPMSLTTYAEVRPWAKAIRKEVAAKRMPPFHASGPLGRFSNDLRLTDKTIKLINRWVDAGVPRGDLRNAPPLPIADSGWSLGEPDLVIDFPEYRVGGKDRDENVYRFAPFKFPHDVWVRTIDFSPRDNRVIHHASIYFTEPGDVVPETPTTGLFHQFNFNTLDRIWHTWGPGMQPHAGYQGAARLIEKGARIGALFHYAPMEEEAIDRTSVGIYFANGKINKSVGILNFIADDLKIPPYAHAYSLAKEAPIPDGIEITHFWVHMHLRGRSSKYIFHYPDGTDEVVLDVPNYNMDWQPMYYLKDSIKAVPNSTAECISVWDNSADNPQNPDPSQTIRFGVRTQDEMGGGIIFYLKDRAPEECVSVVNGIAQ